MLLISGGEQVAQEFVDVVAKVRSEGSGRVAHFMDVGKRVFLESEYIGAHVPQLTCLRFSTVMISRTS